MGETELCRLCANMAEAKYARSLFEQDQQELLRQVEELTGLQLFNSNDLPHHICITCQAQIMQAHEFRERCIQTQKHYNTVRQQSTIKIEPSSNIYNYESEFMSDVDDNDFKPPVDLDNNSKASSDSDDKPLRSKSNSHDNSSKPNINEKDNEFSCAQCGAVLRSSRSLTIHMKRHAGDKPFFCEHCPKQFCTKQECIRHTYTHTGEKPFSCQLCERRFTDKGHVKRHMREFHKKVCKSTNETETKNNSRSILKICDLCGKNFNSHSAFTNHMIRHSGIKRFKCNLCPKAYFGKTQLTIHSYTHTGEKPFLCNICGMAFNDRSPLLMHHRRHKNERRYVCNHCGKSFFTSVVLKKHMVTHSEAREFECQVCNMSFKLKETLTNHLATKRHKNKEANQKILN